MKKTPKRKGKAGPSKGAAVEDASARIDQAIAGLPDWRGKTLSAVRRAVRGAADGVVEEWKWMGSPVWNLDGILCVGNAFKDFVKLTFPKGALMKDPGKLFNAELEGNAWRAIKFFAGDPVDEAGLKALTREAIALNAAKPAARKAGRAMSSTGR
jgi:hypothetical protein